jgi:hypothetical protein
MLTRDRSRRGLRGPIAATVVAASLLSLSGGSAVAMDAASGDMEPGAISATNDPLIVTQLQDQLDLLSVLNGELQADNSTLARSVEDMTKDRDRLQASLGHFNDMFDPLEADRQLLVELRKGLPETRLEAEAQLDRLQRLALTSNPSRLGQIVDRVSDAAPAFLEWRFTQFGSTQEASEAYVSTGANAFDSSMEDFRSAVLLSVANRIDGLLNVIDRVR